MTIAYLSFHLIGPVHPALPGAWPILAVTSLAILSAAVVARKNLGPVMFWIVICCLPFAPLYDTGDPIFQVTSSAYEQRWYHLYLPAAGIAWLLATAVIQRPYLAKLTLVGTFALQLMNADFYAQLGRELQNTHEPASYRSWPSLDR